MGTAQTSTYLWQALQGRQWQAGPRGGVRLLGLQLPSQVGPLP
jgi:hypothetical protein